MGNFSQEEVETDLYIVYMYVTNIFLNISKLWTIIFELFTNAFELDANVVNFVYNGKNRITSLHENRKFVIIIINKWIYDSLYDRF